LLFVLFALQIDPQIIFVNKLFLSTNWTNFLSTNYANFLGQRIEPIKQISINLFATISVISGYLNQRIIFLSAN